MPNVSAIELQTFAAKLLAAGGATPDEAERVAAGLVSANLRGYDSHGVMRIPFYVDMVAAGDVQPGVKWQVMSEGPSRLVVDANWGFGHVMASQMLAELTTKANDGGIGVGTMHRCHHIGRLGEYAEIAADQGLVFMAMVNSHGAVHRVSPPGGKASRLGTNPICIGAPAGDGPLVLDFSTSATAEGKVRVKNIAGESVPDGWLIDADGQPTNDPATLYGDPPGCILPFGGVQAYKGFGLSLMIEILTGALSGGLTSRAKPETPKGNCVFMLVLDPSHFGGADHFAAEVSQLCGFVRSCPTVDGVDGITLPGDPERKVFAGRQTEGIHLDEENWAKLTELAERLGVSLP